MIINKKLTSGDHFTSRNFLHGSVVNTPLTDVSLSILLGRIRATISPVTRLVTVLAWPVRWGNIGVALSRGILWQGHYVPLAKTSFSLILLLGQAVPAISIRWTILGFGYHWCLRLRSTGLKISFMCLGSSIHLIIILLSQGVTDKLIECDTLTVAHSLHQFRGKPPLETSYLFGISINELRSIPC
jgi:hypothetical protein